MNNPHYPRPIIFPLIAWLAAIGFGIVLLVLMTGCATVKEVPKSPRQDICMVQALGQTDSGMPVVALHCITPEEFAAAQK